MNSIARRVNYGVKFSTEVEENEKKRKLFFILPSFSLYVPFFISIKLCCVFFSFNFSFIFRIFSLCSGFERYDLVRPRFPFSITVSSSPGHYFRFENSTFSQQPAITTHINIHREKERGRERVSVATIENIFQTFESLISKDVYNSNRYQRNIITI